MQIYVSALPGGERRVQAWSPDLPLYLSARVHPAGRLFRGLFHPDSRLLRHPQRAADGDWGQHRSRTPAPSSGSVLLEEEQKVS